MQTNEEKIMTISEAKQISLVGYLESLGHSPVRKRPVQKDYWYLSPIRSEHTPSFVVNEKTGEWYDFGIAEGGDIIELAKRLYQTPDAKEALRYIAEKKVVMPQKRIRSPDIPAVSAENEMKNLMIVPLRHHALLSYLYTRGIDTRIARRLCCEIHYELRNKSYFAIAFGNVSNGYEVRNAYYKGCIKGKDISFVGYVTEHKQEHICVFEGFMDFLSYLTLQQRNHDMVLNVTADFLIMNSIANLKQTLAELEHYPFIHCYLDNDIAGRKTTETIVGLFTDKVTDESIRYRDYKDLNDFLRMKRL